jgi:hypothetical protein
MFVFDTFVQDDILLDFQDEFEPTINKRKKDEELRKNKKIL